jgi:hypothetical protein
VPGSDIGTIRAVRSTQAAVAAFWSRLTQQRLEFLAASNVAT